ncbi:MAG: hypothetical protein AAGF82_21330 [Pseudomonadota bacterium]
MACRSTDDSIAPKASRKVCNGDCANCGAVGSILNQLEITPEDGLAGALQPQLPERTEPQTARS